MCHGTLSAKVKKNFAEYKFVLKIITLKCWNNGPLKHLIRMFLSRTLHALIMQEPKLFCYNGFCDKNLFVVDVWRGIHSRSDPNRTGAEGLSFYYHRLLYCLDQMLAVVPLSQHRVSSFKTVRPRAPCGA